MTRPYRTRTGAHRIAPSLDDIKDALYADLFEGWCLGCGELTHDTCEPDARGYECPDCSLPLVYGLEELMALGLVKD